MREWAGAELNRRHEDFQSSALPTELPAHIMKIKDLQWGAPLRRGRWSLKM